MSDPGRRFYAAFDLYTGSLRELFGPAVWLRAIKAFRKGYSRGKPVGNPWTMPGTFMACRGKIVWSHRFNHAGDHPDFEAMPRRMAQHARECMG